MNETVRVFAPATSANLGPGFDMLGVAVTGCGDVVEAKRMPAGVEIKAITGDSGLLPRDPQKNTVGVAAQKTLEIIGADGGVSLTLHKGIGLGTGLGSSAASAAAAIWAVASLYEFEDKRALLPAGLAAEAAVSGYHADNVAPALLGGMIFIGGYQPLNLKRLPAIDDLHLVLVSPKFELLTSKARAVVPKQVPLQALISYTGSLGTLLIACYENDVRAFGKAVVDDIIEPARASLIPGFAEVKQAALAAGAYGCSISGGGPTIFAVCDSANIGETVGQAMQNAFAKAGLTSTINVAQIDPEGARQI